MFLWINRAQIINLNFVDKISAMANGQIKLKLKTGAEYEASARRSIKIKSMGRI